MKRVVLIIFLLSMAGCASGPDKQAAMEGDQTPVASQSAVNVPVAQVAPAIESIAAPPSQQAIPVVQAAPPPPLAAIPETSANANPIDVAGPVSASGADHATSSDSSWADLTRRVTAWANPLRRSMEPYCQDGLVRKP